MLRNFDKRDHQGNLRVKLLLRDFETDLLGQFAAGITRIRGRRRRVLRRIALIGNEPSRFEETVIGRRQPRRQQQQN